MPEDLRTRETVQDKQAHLRSLVEQSNARQLAAQEAGADREEAKAEKKLGLNVLSRHFKFLASTLEHKLDLLIERYSEGVVARTAKMRKKGDAGPNLSTVRVFRYNAPLLVSPLKAARGVTS
ncbi:hypothetical protein HY090_00965 [Candidatus Kaiserbacteria bacterium]|nr:hypothetical protein [Candidatus Kaiserbacteria bacterium]